MSNWKSAIFRATCPESVLSASDDGGGHWCYIFQALENGAMLQAVLETDRDLGSLD